MKPIPDDITMVQAFSRLQVKLMNNNYYITWYYFHLGGRHYLKSILNLWRNWAENYSTPHAFSSFLFAEGYYHGKLVFPKDFPFKPPRIFMTTPNGRFKVNTRSVLQNVYGLPYLGIMISLFTYFNPDLLLSGYVCQ
mgnify:CR=1 FL=1